MTRHSNLGVALLLCGSATAQSFTSPAGLSSIEGNTRFYTYTNRRYMGIDASNTHVVATIRSFALRRDKGAPISGGASTADLTLTLGETNMATVYSEMDRNFLPGKRTLVFPKKNVNWPDWSLPATTPAPFDVRISLLTTYAYNGPNGNALVWDLTLENATNTDNWCDRAITTDYPGSSQVIGTGCFGFSLTTMMRSNGPGMPNFGMRLQAGVTSAPVSTPVALSIALTDANCSVPVLCTTLRALPLAVFPLGVSDASGTVYDCYFQTKYNVTANGLSLVTQAFAEDRGTLRLSNARSSTMPTSAETTGYEACYLFSSLTNVPNTSPVITGGSIVVEFGT